MSKKMEVVEGYAYLSKEVILAIETNVDCDVDLRGFHHYKKLPLVLKARKMSRAFAVKTLEGTMKGKAGDWLVIGTKGELYPVADDIFQEIYVPAPQPSTG